MCVLCHGVGFVEDDDFVWWAGVSLIVSLPILDARRWSRQLHSRKVLNLIPDDADSALIGSVQFEDAGREEERAVKGFCEGENSGGLSGSWWTVEEHVWEVGGLEGALEGRDGVVLGCDVRKGFWAARSRSISMMIRVGAK